MLFTLQWMDEPKILMDRLAFIFHLICFCLAMYMTGLLIHRYCENNDNSVLVINEYNKNPSDKYPTFSICFKGTEFQWNHDIHIFNAYALNGTQYQLMLQGKDAMRYKLNYSAMIYDKMQVFADDAIDFNYNRFYLQATDFLTGVEFLYENSDKRPKNW